MTLLDLWNFMENHDKVQISFIVNEGTVYFNALAIDPSTKKHFNHNIAFSLYETRQLVSQEIITDQLKDIIIRLDKRLKDSFLFG